jgi:uncharacterized protein YktB (UPF0637 family)
VAILGFTPTDFDVFKIVSFGTRMEKIYQHVRPKLIRLGNQLAPELSRKLHLEFFPHVPKHMRRAVNPPAETWVAFGPSPRGYKRYGHLALCISRAGLHARAVIKSDADSRPEIASELETHRARLVRHFTGTQIARYERWDFAKLPAAAAASPELFDALAADLRKKTGRIDLGFGWKVSESLRLERGEVIEALCELAPLYRILTRNNPVGFYQRSRTSLESLPESPEPSANSPKGPPQSATQHSRR